MKRRKILNSIAIALIIISIPFSLKLVNQKTNFFNRASDLPANLVIDANNVIETDKTEVWRNLAQGGEDRTRQLLPIQNEVKALRPKYIRIDHVFDFYNSEELDLIIGDITKAGAKPFVALSYMPPSLSSTGNTTDLPKDWAEWENLVQKTVERISGRNGLNISDVYYEVWNEPDLFGGFKTYGDKNYLDLYYHTAIGVQRAMNVNNYKIGGPAVTGFYENWLNRLLVYTQENNLRLDFLSWHRYSKVLSDYEDDFNNSDHFQGYETVISEMGPNSENDTVYDNNFSALHLIATTALLEGKVDKIFNFEIKDGIGPEKYWGRWGMITNEKWGTPEIKPRYRAVQFLNNLIGGKTIKVDGSGSFVKSIAKSNPPKGEAGVGKIQVLIVNYDHKGTHAEAVPLKITNLPSNNLKLKRINFNGANSESVLNLESNTYETTLFFEPNSASILELTAL